MTNRDLRIIHAILAEGRSVTSFANELGIQHHTQLGSRLFHALKAHIEADPKLKRRILRSLTSKP